MHKKDRVTMISKVSVPTDEKNYLFFRNIKNEADGKTKKK